MNLVFGDKIKRIECLEKLIIYPRNRLSFADTQLKEEAGICHENDREWSDFSIYLALPLEHCLSAEGASLREAAKISVCRKIVGTNVFAGHIPASSFSVSLPKKFPMRFSKTYRSLSTENIALILGCDIIRVKVIIIVIVKV